MLCVETPPRVASRTTSRRRKFVIVVADHFVGLARRKQDSRVPSNEVVFIVVVMLSRRCSMFQEGRDGEVRLNLGNGKRQ